MVALKIKRVKCLTGRPANPIQSFPTTGVLGKRKAGDLCVGYASSRFRLFYFAHRDLRFGEEAQTDTQSQVTWQVTSYEDDTPGVKPRTFVTFVFRYRSPGGFFLA